MTVAKTYDVRTHGCQMNVHDSERLAGLLAGPIYAVQPGMVGQLAKQFTDPCRAARLEHVIERLEPFARFERFELRRVLWGSIPHSSLSQPIRSGGVSIN